MALMCTDRNRAPKCEPCGVSDIHWIFFHYFCCLDSIKPVFDTIFEDEFFDQMLYLYFNAPLQFR